MKIAPYFPKTCLFHLPAEIRNIIYDYIIASGDLTALCASKAVHHEAVDPFAKRKIFRIYLGFPVWNVRSLPFMKATVMV